MEETLDKTLFSAVNDNITTSQMSSRKGSARRVIVFVLGGITYSECRIASEVAKYPKYKGSEIIVGGSKVITPNSFVQDLKNLNNPDLSLNDPEDISENDPLMGNGVSHSNLEINEENESFFSSCERHLIQGGRILSETFSACTSNMCTRTT